MDATIYPDGVTVEATLKQVWQSTNLLAQFRVKMATQGLTELSIFAGISDTLTGFKESISTFFEESELGATPPAKDLELDEDGHGMGVRKVTREGEGVKQEAVT